MQPTQHILKKNKTVMLALALCCVLASWAQVKVGVFLPFKSGGQTARCAVEYYRGLLMAIDSLSHDGTTTFSVVADDCGTTADDMAVLLDESKHGVFDIIFAPSNQQQMEVLDRYSRLNGTKLAMPFGGRYDEWVTNPNFYALKVTQTDYTPQACKLVTNALKDKTLYVVSANGGKEICPFANYVLKYVKGVKQLDWPDKEEKITRLMADPDVVLIPSMYDATTQQCLQRMAAGCSLVRAAVIGYPAWFESALTDADNKLLCQMNAYVIQPYFQHQALPRVRKFLGDYETNFDTNVPQTVFSFPMWGFDTGYYLLKGLVRHHADFYNQQLYSAPLQSAFRVEPRATAPGLINTMVLLVHYKTDGTQELIESNE